MSPRHLYHSEACSSAGIRDFIEQHHYSHNVNGCIMDYCFKLLDVDNNLVGAAFFGRMAMANQWKAFGEKPEDVIELRRLVCIDDTPKNTESFFIGSMLRWLAKHTTLKVVVSYADATYGHEGIVYKASNFKYNGFKKGAPVINHNGKLYHDKAIRTKYKGVLKPFAQRLVVALENGEAFYQPTLGKHCYTYELRR